MVEVVALPENQDFRIVQSSSGPAVLDERAMEFVEKWRDSLWINPCALPDFEKKSPIGEENRKKYIEYMTSLPQEEAQYLFRQGVRLADIAANVTKHKALELMYVGPVRAIEPTVEHFLWSTLNIGSVHNSMAVRNRLRIVEDQFTQHLLRLFDTDVETIDVLSVAAGSNRAMVEVLAGFNRSEQQRVNLHLIDSSRNALNDAQKLAESLNLNPMVAQRALFTDFKRYLKDGFYPSFVEIVGLLDYVQDEDTISLLSHIREQMAEGGRAIFSNINPNDEEKFTHGVVGWLPMIYRTEDNLLDLAVRSGFKEEKLKLIREPLDVYNLVVAEK